MLAGEVQPPQVYYADAAVLLQELGAALKAVYPAAVGLTVTSGFVSVLSAFPLYQKKLREMRSGVMPPRYPEGRHRLEMQYSGAATCDYVGVQVCPRLVLLPLPLLSPFPLRLRGRAVLHLHRLLRDALGAVHAHRNGAALAQGGWVDQAVSSSMLTCHIARCCTCPRWVARSSVTPYSSRAFCAQF
jgi:hypothetical protein